MANRTTFRSLIILTAMVAAGSPLAAQQHRPKAAHRETSAELKAAAKVPEATARATAIAQVPGGTIQSYELEREKGHLLYSYDIKVSGKPGIEEIQVDALTGKLLAHEHESPKAERKEARAEAKEKAGSKKPQH